MNTLILALMLACSGSAPDSTPSAPPPPGQEEPMAPAPPAPLPAPSGERYAASHVLITWAGAIDAPEAVTRTEPEAKGIAEGLHSEAQAGADFAALAQQHSEGPSKRRDGSIGVYLTGTMMPDFEASVASVQPGKIAPLVKTPFGWHVIRRDAIVQARISHLLVAHTASHQNKATRTRDEARVRIEAAQTKLKNGVGFASVATEFSDDRKGANGGDVGIVAPGQFVPDFEKAALALEVGARSDIVETPYGFHILLRTE